MDILRDIEVLTKIKKNKGKVKFVPRTKENQIYIPDPTPLPAKGPGSFLETLNLETSNDKNMDEAAYFDDEFPMTFDMSNESIEKALKERQKQRQSGEDSRRNNLSQEPAILPETEAPGPSNVLEKPHHRRRRNRGRRNSYRKELEKFEGEIMVPCEEHEEVYVNRLRYGVSSDEINFKLDRKGETKTKTPMELLMEATDEDFEFEKRH